MPQLGIFVNGQFAPAQLGADGIDGVIKADEKGAPNGLAKLNSSAQVDASQLGVERIISEQNTVTLTNTLEYPFSDSKATIIFAKPFQTNNYFLFAYEVISATIEGGLTYSSSVANNFISGVCISDKLLNGCKIEFSGSATSVTIEYVIAEVVPYAN